MLTIIFLGTTEFCSPSVKSIWILWYNSQITILSLYIYYIISHIYNTISLFTHISLHIYTYIHILCAIQLLKNPSLYRDFSKVLLRTQYRSISISWYSIECNIKRIHFLLENIYDIEIFLYDKNTPLQYHKKSDHSFIRLHNIFSQYHKEILLTILWEILLTIS